MRFTYLALENYIGIYNGMGLHKIEINMTLCKHKMLIIRGENGSGKSTIFNAMSVFPDSNESFIPGMAASKVVDLYDGSVIYRMTFIHPVKNDGSRDTTKAYLTKNIPGQPPIELNPNGNISSYKEILYDELGLDPNFIALSQLSLDDKGLAGKKPAERKRFINAIMSSLEVYNNIYKTLSKRSSSIKAIMNTISTKLGALGDPGVLQANLDSLESQINIYNTQKDEATQQLMKYKAQKELLDPDGSIQLKHTTLASRVAQDKKDLRKVLRDIPLDIFDINWSLDRVNETISANQSELNKLDIQISSINKENEQINNSIRELEGQVIQKKNMINSLSSQESYEEMCNKMDALTDTLEFLSDEIRKTGVEPGIINKDEYVMALNILQEIKTAIRNLKDHYDYHMVNEIMDRFRSGDKPTVYDTFSYQTYIDKYLERSPILNEKIREYDSDLEKLKLLSNRPADCLNDTCPFIADLIRIQNSNIPYNRSQAVRELNELEICYENSQLQLKRVSEWNRCINEFNHLLRLVELNGRILTKLPHGAIYTNIITFIDALFANEDFTYIDQLYKYIDLANYFDEYNVTKRIYDDLIKKHDLYLSKSDVIEQLESELRKINESLTTYRGKLENNRESLTDLDEKHYLLISSIERNNIYKDLLTKASKILDSITKNTEEMNSIVDKMAKITNCDTMINEYASKVISISSQLEPLLRDRDKVNHSIQMVKDYQDEMETIRQQYDLVESIKYYSSPTTGIQLVFMELYMGKIIGLANELLNNLFNGQYTIQPFIINESEFRIPCLGDGYINDDISSMSSAQIAMISMIISFSLLYNSSTKYNVIKLDEIDGPLDENNRILFTEVLNRIMSIMNTEQCVLISHNSELNVDNSDVILLKSSNLSTDYNRGNVIWKY